MTTTETQQLNDLWKEVASARKEATMQSLMGNPRLANFWRRASLKAQREIRRIYHAALAVEKCYG